MTREQEEKIKEKIIELLEDQEQVKIKWRRDKGEENAKKRGTA